MKPAVSDARHKPPMSALVRLILNSRTLQRLMERLDTREGVRQEDAPRFLEPTPSRPSDRLLPEKGTRRLRSDAN